MALVRLLEQPPTEGIAVRGASYLWRVAYTVVIDEIRRFGRQQRQAEQLAREERGRSRAGGALGDPRLPRRTSRPATHRGHAPSAGLSRARGRQCARMDGEAGREPGLPRPGRPPDMPRGGRDMTESTDELAQRFRAAVPVTDGTACPPADDFWTAADGELPFERARALVDHGARCARCAEAWRILSDVRREAADALGDQSSRQPLAPTPSSTVPSGRGRSCPSCSRRWLQAGCGSRSGPATRPTAGRARDAHPRCAPSPPRNSRRATRCCDGPRCPAPAATT